MTHTWTTERPREAGFYWFKSSGFRRGVVQVTQSGVHFCSGLALSLSDIHGEFAGPILPPEEGR